MKKDETKVTVVTGGTQFGIDSKQILKSIVEDETLARLSKELAERRAVFDNQTKATKIKDFIKEIANDETYAEVITVKSRERNFVRNMYEKTDLNKFDIMYLFSIPPQVFNNWYREDGWKKLNSKKVMDGKTLITMLYAGEFNIIHVPKEEIKDLKKRYNGTYYRINAMATSLLDDAMPDGNLLNALVKVTNIVNICYDKQMDIRNYANNAKDRKLIELREIEMELKEREVKALEDANNIRIVSPNVLEEGKFTATDMYMHFKRFLNEKDLEDEQKEYLMEEFTKDFGVNPPEVEEVDEN